MKHLNNLAMSFAFMAMPALAQTDNAVCHIGANVLKTSYDFTTQAVSVEMTQNGTTQLFKGTGYQSLTAQEVNDDEVLTGLADISHTSLTAINSAAVFSIFETKDGNFALVKFLDTSGATLATAGVNGESPFTCD